MSKLENKQYNFLELLEKVGVKIPIIQRDYAQGRIEAKDVRDRFLDSLFNVIFKGNSINLDFVYGTVKDNYLIPLDGQQRLTTLFLLHYYLALKEEKLDDNLKNKLKKFTYETRISSREFCRLLIEKEIVLNDKNISQTIKNQTWFFSEWKNDPTIKSMLTMLDSIQEKFKDCENCFDKLNNITFSFLNLEDFKLTDELYIKMNARGKPLSDFENFKSRFEEWIDKTDFNNEEKVNIKAKLDNDWYDIFWKMTKNEKNPSQIADKKFFNFFKNITAFYSEKFDEVNIFKFDYRDKINEITKILDCLTEYGKYKNIVEEIRDYGSFKIDVFQDFLEDSEKITYEKRLRFYALAKFFIKVGKIEEKNETLFKRWMRVSLNLIHNTIYNKVEDYKRLKETLDKMADLLDDDFYKRLSDSTISATEQFKEERLKAKLILYSPEWEDEFIKAEKHWYLDGKIGFLIEFAGGEDNFNIDEFIKYRNKFVALWGFAKEDQGKDQKNRKNEHLIQRALLTITMQDDSKGYIKDTQHSKSDRYTFCTFGTSLREKNENWKQVFGSDYFKSLLDKIKENEDIKEQLKKIIDDYEFSCEDWKSYVINPKKDWSILEYARNYQIEWKDENNIFLNRGYGDGIPAVNSWRWTRSANLYSYYFYRDYSTKFEDYECDYEENSERNYMYIGIKDFYMDILFENVFLLEIDKKYAPKNIEQIGFKDDLPKHSHWRLTTEFTKCEMKKLYNYIRDLLQKFKDTT